MIFWNLCVHFPVPPPFGRDHCNVGISHRFNLQLSTWHNSWLNNTSYNTCLLFLYHSSVLLLVLFTLLVLKVLSHIMLLKWIRTQGLIYLQESPFQLIKFKVISPYKRGPAYAPNLWCHHWLCFPFGLWTTKFSFTIFCFLILTKGYFSIDFLEKMEGRKWRGREMLERHFD